MRSAASITAIVLLSSLLGAASGIERVGASEYRIGPGDVLSIAVWDNKDLDQKVFVRPDGKISLPLLGQVEAGGLTVAELSATLTEMYSKTVKGAHVTVDVTEIRSQGIYFVGGVGKPGPLQLTQDLTLLQAISMVGGLAQGVDLRSATVLRGNQVIPVDFVKLIQRGDIDENIKLQPGDTIVVPVAGVVYVQGEVRAPNAIRFTKGLTIVKAIVQAGGFTPMAAPKRVSLLRGTGTNKQTIEVNVRKIMEEGPDAPDVPLEPDDIITVPQRLF
jgi:polysaccharide export outer membrane protein